MAELREALRTQRPSLELQRAALSEIARLDAIVASTRDQAARDALLRIGEAAKSAGWKDGDLIEFVAGKLGQPSEAQKPDRWMIRYNDDGEFGQATGWLYRDGGHPCIVTGKPVWVWRPLSALLAKTGHQVTRPAAQSVQVQVPEGQALVPGWNWLAHPDWNDGEPTPAWVEVDGADYWYMPVNIENLTQFAWDERDDAWEIAAAPLPPAQTEPRAGFVQMPKLVTAAMQEVFSDGDWQWNDLLAAAEVITESEHAALERCDNLSELLESLDDRPEPVNRRLLEVLRECLFYLNDNLGSLEASLAAKRGEAAIAEAEAQLAAKLDQVPPSIREAVEAAFEQRPGWRQKIAAAVRHLGEPAAAQPVSREALSGSERAELEHLRTLVNTPELQSFRDGVVLEAAHQRERWGSDHDAGKAPSDWFWLVGYLAGKALHAQVAGNTEKALHHTISTAAALANWHASLTGEYTEMRPGIDPKAHVITGEGV